MHNFASFRNHNNHGTSVASSAHGCVLAATLAHPRLQLPLSCVSTHYRPVHAGAPLGLAPFVMEEDDHLEIMRQRQRATERTLRETQPWQVTTW